MVEEKEKLLVEINSKYIDLLYKESTLFYKKLTIFGAIIAFIISVGLLSFDDLNLPILVFVYLALIYLIHINNLYGLYVYDLYEDLLIAIKKDKIVQFKIKRRNWFERQVWYKSRYK